jgi:hypothetical protein
LAVLLRAIRKDAQRPVSRSIASFLFPMIAIHAGAIGSAPAYFTRCFANMHLRTSYLHSYCGEQVLRRRVT